MTDLHPHDLVRLTRPVVPDTAPPWVKPALRRAPWAVVRRARAAPGAVSVGVRGRNRAERFAMVVALDTVCEVLPPDALTARADALPANLPAVRALHGVRPHLDAMSLRWGPGGSVGFELATGLSTVTPGSDLDIVLTVTDVPPRAQLIALHEALRLLPARADCQLATPHGGMALAELASGTDQVLLRTATGPRLIPSPWRTASGIDELGSEPSGQTHAPAHSG